MKVASACCRGTNPARRLLRRRAQRGNAVLVVVLVTMLLAAMGVYSVRNISLVDQAVGYGRQAEQTAALAELGTTSAMAYIAGLNRDQLQRTSLDPNLRCVTNGVVPLGRASTCYPFTGDSMATVSTNKGGPPLLEKASATESGSFGVSADVQGVVDIELTDVQEAPFYLKGRALSEKPLDATVTTRARVMPNQTSGDPCGPSVSSMTAKKVLRAHAIF
ncbi:MAG TPA: hypothetical protein VHB79_14255 [Polyangiaceae bacterium]|nr:hypothetical protein [Polyangiaceae bacterium]